nr:protein angel-like isoform X3 [Onthophagus taurus]
MMGFLALLALFTIINNDPTASIGNVETTTISVESRGSSSAKGSGSRSSARSNSILGMRRWDLTNFGKLYYRQNKTESGVVFTIISYNVLAQDLLMEHPELYNGNDQNALQWDFRYKNLYQEIKEKNGDVIINFFLIKTRI